MKIKVRFYILSAKDNTIVIRPMPDDNRMINPNGNMMNFSLTTEIETDDLIVEKHWDVAHKPI